MNLVSASTRMRAGQATVILGLLALLPSCSPDPCTLPMVSILSVVVTDAQTGAPITNATVRATPATSSGQIEAQGSANGVYEISGAGTYSIVVEAPGYQSRTFPSVVVPCASIEQLDVWLQPE